MSWFPARAKSDRREYLTDVADESVTLAVCSSLDEADLLLTHLAAAGIPALLPEKFLTHGAAVDLTAKSEVPVQVASRHYDTARRLLAGLGVAGFTHPANPAP